ncbi:MAG: HpcH/HpaI aldolase/citrate lyase family protein, partial [Deltaproteobacteria bacterium]|nr:HpcH/HpaI aldolase/citrate lyase family protein [Deltaproteobacteria bacterium]
MTKSIKYGATMYMPALRPDLDLVANGHKYPALRTVVFCTEDSLSLSQLPAALDNLRASLPKLEPTGLYRFIRPRNPEVLKVILSMPHINRINGFVIPKADRFNLPEYFRLLERRDGFELMPTIETDVAFDLGELYRLRDYLSGSPIKSKIACLRIGSLDLLSILGLRRDLNLSIYDTPVGHAIDQLITVFKPVGFELSAPGFEGLDMSKVLSQELSLDISRGLFAKTCVHPCQIEIIQDAYQVLPEEYLMAREVLNPENPAVFRLNDRMCEKAVHTNWANGVIERAQLFGAF